MHCNCNAMWSATHQNNTCDSFCVNIVKDWRGFHVKTPNDWISCNPKKCFWMLQFLTYQVLWNQSLFRTNIATTKNGAVHHVEHVQWKFMKMIVTHFVIIKDRQLYIFINTFYMLNIPDNNDSDCAFWSCPHFLDTQFWIFPDFQQFYFFLEFVIFCFHTLTTFHIQVHCSSILYLAQTSHNTK